MSSAELHAYLAQWRESADHAANTVRVHADLAQCCVEVADDDALIHHAGCAINAARALARIVNEMTRIRADAGLVTINIRPAAGHDIAEAAE
ncbi:hypothetical protein [Methylocella sp.]|uniref:hypothetical protein n=1 Tax=Methylocella sp. TaxID=1978226 RepID=UPI0035B1D547